MSGTVTRIVAKFTLTLEDVEANAAQPVDVGMVDLGEEADLGRSHGVVVWQEELELEDTACMLLVYDIQSLLMRLNVPS